MDKDFFHTRHILPNLPLEMASEEDIIEMIEEKLEEKKMEKNKAYPMHEKRHTQLYRFTIKQLLTELAYRMR
jgi:hypothetical protein